MGAFNSITEKYQRNPTIHLISIDLEDTDNVTFSDLNLPWTIDWKRDPEPGQNLYLNFDPGDIVVTASTVTEIHRDLERLEIIVEDSDAAMAVIDLLRSETSRHRCLCCCELLLRFESSPDRHVVDLFLDKLEYGLGLCTPFEQLFSLMMRWLPVLDRQDVVRFIHVVCQCLMKRPLGNHLVSGFEEFLQKVSRHEELLEACISALWTYIGIQGLETYLGPFILTLMPQNRIGGITRSLVKRWSKGGKELLTEILGLINTRPNALIVLNKVLGVLDSSICDVVTSPRLEYLEQLELCLVSMSNHCIVHKVKSEYSRTFSICFRALFYLSKHTKGSDFSKTVATIVRRNGRSLLYIWDDLCSYSSLNERCSLLGESLISEHIDPVQHLAILRSLGFAQKDSKAAYNISWDTYEAILGVVDDPDLLAAACSFFLAHAVRGDGKSLEILNIFFNDMRWAPQLRYRKMTKVLLAICSSAEDGILLERVFPLLDVWRLGNYIPDISKQYYRETELEVYLRIYCLFQTRTDAAYLGVLLKYLTLNIPMSDKAHVIRRLNQYKGMFSASNVIRPFYFLLLDFPAIENSLSEVAALLWRLAGSASSEESVKLKRALLIFVTEALQQRRYDLVAVGIKTWGLAHDTRGLVKDNAERECILGITPKTYNGAEMPEKWRTVHHILRTTLPQNYQATMLIRKLMPAIGFSMPHCLCQAYLEGRIQKMRYVDRIVSLCGHPSSSVRLKAFECLTTTWTRRVGFGAEISRGFQLASQAYQNGAEFFKTLLSALVVVPSHMTRVIEQITQGMALDIGHALYIYEGLSVLPSRAQRRLLARIGELLDFDKGTVSQNAAIFVYRLARDNSRNANLRAEIEASGVQYNNRSPECSTSVTIR